MTANIKISIRNVYFKEYLSSIDSWKIADEDKKGILVFVRDYQLGKVTGNQAKEGTIKSVLCYIKLGLETLKKPSSKLKLEDIEKLSELLLKNELRKNISRWNSEPTYVPFSEIGKIKLKNALIAYLKWKLKEKADKMIKMLNMKPRLKEATPDYLKESDIEKLYNACATAEQRFMIAVLFDSGARAEEFHNIRVEDIDLPKEGETFVKLTLKEEYSKTKGRVISLYWKNSLSAVREYLNMRISQGAKYGDQVILKSYGGGRQFFTRLGNKILKRHVHYHLFRHSSATYYADKMNRQQLCIRYGWRFSSPMPDRYINRGGVHQDELDKRFESTKFEDLKVHLEKQSRENSVLKEKQDILEAELEKRRKFDPFLNKLMNNPKIVEFIGNLVEA
ncbi:MAG: site-specific integrase [Candidatus Pacearchaeota archaeon]|jgi:integrase